MKSIMLAAAAALALGGAPALATTPAGTTAAAKSAATGSENVINTAVANGQFTTLAKAIDAAGMGDALKTGGPFTILAPTDAAFAKLPAGTVETLLKPENKAQLVALLNNHVLAGQARADYFTGKTGELSTLGGGKLTLDGTNGVKIGAASVTQPDIMASNGVIHAIDTVLLPDAAAPVQGSAE